MNTIINDASEKRPYKIEVYSLQDAYLGTLQAYNDIYIGQIIEPSLKVSIDGSHTFSCSIPKYYIDPITNERTLNPRWLDFDNNILAENTRILKVFVQFADKTKVYPFIIDTITEARDSHYTVLKTINANGLAFAELGKIGYKLEFNQNIIELEQTDSDIEIVPTLNYWLDKVFPNKKDESGKIIEWLTPWCYQIQTSWDNPQRKTDKMYEDSYIDSWKIEDSKLVPNSYHEGGEKARIIEASGSNKYNITQNLSEVYEMFCDYEYKTDATGKFIKTYEDDFGNVWTGKKVIFKNKGIKTDEPIYIDYQKNLDSINKTKESADLYTKLYISPIEATNMESGYVSIADTEANPLLDEYILNFDYLYETGGISDYQRDFINAYKIEIRKINDSLIDISPLQEKAIFTINELEAAVTGAETSIGSYEEQKTYYFNLANNNLVSSIVKKDVSNSCSCIFVPKNDYRYATLHFEGVISATISGYKDYKYQTQLFNSTNITIVDKETSPDEGDNNIYVVNDEHGFAIGIYTKNSDIPDLIYLELEYSPANKYRAIYNDLSIRCELEEQSRDRLKSLLETQQSYLNEKEQQIDDLLLKKEELSQQLERVLGLALREGYWTPDSYQDPRENYEIDFIKGPSGPLSSAPQESSFFFDSIPFDNEQLAYEWDNIELNRKSYFPYIKLTSGGDQSEVALMGEEEITICLQKPFESAPLNAALKAGNYYIEFNNIKYYFSRKEDIPKGAILKIEKIINNLKFTINNVQIPLSTMELSGASNITDKFNTQGTLLGDNYLYLTSDFVPSFLYLKDKEEDVNYRICPVLLFINNKIDYLSYSRVCYQIGEEFSLKLFPRSIQENTQHYEVYYPRIYLNEKHIQYNSDTLKLFYFDKNLNKYDSENTSNVKLNKYEDYSILTRERKPYITLHGSFNQILKKNIHIAYQTSRASEILYIEADKVAKDNSRPRVSYEITYAAMDNHYEAIDLGQLAYISDPLLGVRAASAYVSEIEYNLASRKEDSYGFKNYKTKFEDLFESITASSEAMKVNQRSYDLAASSFDPTGAISGSVLQTSINKTSLAFNYTQTGIEITPNSGIILTNKKPYINGVYGQMVLKGGGIFLSNSVDSTGARIWSQSITPEGINASLLTAGQIDTSKIRVFSGEDLAFQWNSEGIFAFKMDTPEEERGRTFVQYSQNGLRYIKADENEEKEALPLVSLDWDGLTLRNLNREKTFQLDAETGNIQMSGTLSSFNYSPGIIGSGWKIDEKGYAEFNDIFVRGTISAAVFEYKETSAVGGEMYIAPTLIFDQSAVDNATISYIENNPLSITIPSPLDKNNEGAGRVWKIGDLIGFNGIFIDNNEKKYEIKNLRMRVAGIGEKLRLETEANISSITQNIFYDENGELIPISEVDMRTLKGSGKWHFIFLGGNGGREGILLTAMDVNGPYIDIYDDSTNVESDTSPRVRLGKLEGLKNYSKITEIYPNIKGYGLYSDNVYLKGAIYATSGRIGSLSIDEVAELPNSIESNSTILSNITTEVNGKVIINKGAITADSISAGLITVNHLASEVGKELNISSNKSITSRVTTEDMNSAITTSANGILATVEDKGYVTGTTLQQTATSIKGSVIDGSTSSGKVETSAVTIDTKGIDLKTTGVLTLNSGSTMTLNSGGTLNIKSGGKFTIDSKNFKIDANGNVTIEGAITATSGKIGPLEVSDNSSTLKMTTSENQTFTISENSITFGEGGISLSANGIISGKSASFDSLVVGGMDISALGKTKYVVSNSKPAGNDLLWFKPESYQTSTATWTTEASGRGEPDLITDIPHTYDEYLPMSGVETISAVSGSKITYTLTLNIIATGPQNYNNISITPTISDGTGTLVFNPVKTSWTQWKNADVVFTGTSTYNFFKSEGINTRKLQLSYKASTSVAGLYLQSNSQVVLTAGANANSTSEYQECSIYYIP